MRTMSKRRQLENNPKSFDNLKIKQLKVTYTQSYHIPHCAIFFLYVIKIGNVNQNSRGEIFFKTFLLTSQNILNPSCKNKTTSDFPLRIFQLIFFLESKL